ncbi:MAG: endonuclease III [Nitrospiraceae bacterium]|nr:endonuclease III [Nitrospiraceae bacterium]
MKSAAPVGEVLKRLEASIPDPKMELTYRSPFELLVATVLSAQTTDRMVNRVTPALFGRYPDPKALAASNLADLEEILRPTGFFHRKALHVRELAAALLQKFDGRVPDRMDDLVTLPGVGRKTASVVLAHAFHKPAIFVDTHVGRVCRRLGWTRSDNPEKIEQTLSELLPRELWIDSASRLLLHGRYICLAKNPLCGQCVLSDICPSALSS